MRVARSYARQVALPLLVGGAIYLLARPDGLRMFAWADALGAGGALHGARASTAALASAMPAWVKWSLPDALWAFALMRVFCILWKSRLTGDSAPWLVGAAVIALGSEVGQALHVVPGTFDPLDLWLLSAGVLAGAAPLLRASWKRSWNKRGIAR